MGYRRQCAAWHQPGLCVVDDGDHEDRPGWAQVSWPGHRIERVRRIPRGWCDSLPHWLPRLEVRAAPGAILCGGRLRNIRDRALDLACARHASLCPAGNRVAVAAIRYNEFPP